MKILCVGDIHAKTWIIPSVQRLFESESFDKVVFLGDYLDDWNATPADNEMVATQLTKLYEQYGRHIVLLWGNHDLSNIRKGAFICSGYSPANIVAANILSKLPLQFAYGHGNLLLTHAGVTNSWRKSVGLAEPIRYGAQYFADKLNELKAECYNRTGTMRGGVDDPSPVWADLEELKLDPVPNIDQVVGHTPVRECRMYNPAPELLGTRIVTCDTFSTYTNGIPYGDETVLGINDDFWGNFNVYNLHTMERKKR
ncbi:MAG: metallophosphoesterase [Acetobacter sp.]|nr:metallophosphoesterase [Acetobacter sp.]